MPRPTEHHSDERVVSGPIFNPFSYAHTDACNQVGFAFLQIVDMEGVEATMTLPNLLASECREAKHAAPEPANALVDQAFQRLISKERHCVEQLFKILFQYVHLRQHESA